MRRAYHLVMPKLLGFPHIVQEAAAYLFGVPHRHEHFASTLEYKSKCWLMEAGQRPPHHHLPPPPTVMHTLMKCASTSGGLLSAIPGRCQEGILAVTEQHKAQQPDTKLTRISSTQSKHSDSKRQMTQPRVQFTILEQRKSSAWSSFRSATVVLNVAAVSH